MILFLLACASSKSGSHGSSDTLDETFTDSAGLSAKVALVLPEEEPDGAAPGVLLFFTWDFGNQEYFDQAELHAELAQEHGLIVASMASPKTPGDSGCWWAPRVEDNAAYVDEFVQARLVDELGIDTDRVFTTGLSGGSDFAAAFHFHTDYRYGGGAVALCGGDIPRLNGGGCEPDIDPEPALTPTDLSTDTLDAVRYDLSLTVDDFLREHAEAAAAYYDDLGFSHVRQRIVEGSGHCGFDSGWEGLDVFAEGLDYVDPRTNPG